MRILRLDLLRFGCFTDVALDLADGHADLHVIYGTNEAGKSSALRALEAWLFGFEERTSDSFIHNYSQLRLGGRLRNADSELAFRRRKARKQTILDEDEKPLPDDALAPFLHGVTRDQFRLMFGLGHQGLVEGGREILRGGGEVGQALVSAGMGGAQVRALLKQLEEDAGALYKAGGINPPINKLLSNYRDTKKKRDEASLSSKEWKAHDDALQQAQADLQRVVAEIAGLTNRQSRLQSLRGILPALGLRTKLLGELQELGSVVELRPGFAEERKIAESKLCDAMRQVERARGELERLSGEIGLIAVPEELIAQENTITDLHERLGSHRKAATDRGGLEKKRGLLQAAVADILSDLPIEITSEELVTLDLDVGQRMRLRQLAAGYAAITEAMSATMKIITASERKLRRAKNELADAAVPRDVSGLKRALERVQRGAGIEEALEKARVALGARDSKITAAVRQLHPPLPEGSDIEALPMPLIETVNRFVDRFRAAEAELVRRDEELEEARKEQAGVVERLEAIRLSAPVPSEEDLDAARQQREDGWQLIRREWLHHEDIVAEAAAYDRENALPEAYEHRVREADEVADRLRREADRVAEQARLVAGRAALESQIGGIETDRQHIEQLQNELLIEWDAQWRPSDIEPLSPNENASLASRVQDGTAAGRAASNGGRRGRADAGGGRAPQQRTGARTAAALCAESPRGRDVVRALGPLPGIGDNGRGCGTPTRSCREHGSSPARRCHRRAAGSSTG